MALGNAGGNGGLPTVTSGTITSLDRTITASDAGSGTSERLTHMFQTNAPIAEGDSGGALANSAGQVIAMNTAANSQNIGGAGTDQGFSIPIDRALLIARQIAAGHGSSTIQIGQPAFIGIAIASDPKSNAPSSSSNPRTQLGQLQQLARGNYVRDQLQRPVPGHRDGEPGAEQHRAGQVGRADRRSVLQRSRGDRRCPGR